MSTLHTHCALPWSLDAQRADAFGQACGDTFLFSDDSAVLPPPMAVVCGSLPLGVRRVLEDPGVIVDRARLVHMVHLEEDITWHRPLEVGAVLWVASHLKERRFLKAGETLQIATTLTDSVGVCVISTLSTVFIRGEGTDPTPSPAPKGQGASRPIPQGATKWQVQGDQPERYAHASGEDNRIHLDDDFARQAGLRGKILHGMCTMAFAARCVTDEILSGDRARLKRFRARFAQPVYPDSTLFCALVPDEDGSIGISVLHADGARALSRGTAWVSGSPQSI